MKNLCILKYFPSHKEIYLSKIYIYIYTLDLLQETSMLTCQLVVTLVEEV